MRGHKVTERDKFRVGMFSSYLDLDGNWKHNVTAVAAQCELDTHTITELWRQAYVREWERTRWKKPYCPEDS